MTRRKAGVTVRDGALASRLTQDLRGLLDAAFEGQFSDEDWDHTLGGWHVVISAADDVLAHAAVVSRKLWVGDQAVRCGYVEGVATRPDRQRQGLGARVMGAAADVIRTHFEVGALSTPSPAFYERLGWERWRGPTYVRMAAGTMRTPDEDDGVMVLRFGASAGIDLTAPITCEDRPGDAW